MTKEEIVNHFYETVGFTKSRAGWKTPFDPERQRGDRTCDL